MNADVATLVTHPERTALVVIDMQNDFVLPDGPVPAAGAVEIVPRIAEVIARARGASLPVVFTMEMHRADKSDFGIELEFEPPHCLEGTQGAEIVDGLRVSTDDRVIRNKRRYDAFLGTDLDLVLRLVGAENLIVVGVCTDVCVTSTVQHARNMDYRCFVARDAVAGSTRQRHDAALSCLEHVFAHVGDAEEIFDVFGI